MNDNHVFDGIARVLASPMPRRQAFKHILRGLAGAAVMASFWPEVARADPVPVPDQNGNCPGNHTNCNGVVCCNNNTQTCCGTSCCRPNQMCEGDPRTTGRCVSKASPSHPRG